MCFSSGVSSSPVPAVATASDPTILAALNNERLLQSQAQGRQSTILTGTGAAAAGAAGSIGGAGFPTTTPTIPMPATTILGR